MLRGLSHILIVLLLVGLGGLSSYASDCPSGTTKKSEVTKRGLRVESCEDGAGKKQGIQITWHKNGKVVKVEACRDGKCSGVQLRSQRMKPFPVEVCQDAIYRSKKGLCGCLMEVVHDGDKEDHEIFRSDDKTKGRCKTEAQPTESVQLWNVDLQEGPSGYFLVARVGTKHVVIADIGRSWGSMQLDETCTVDKIYLHKTQKFRYVVVESSLQSDYNHGGNEDHNSYQALTICPLPIRASCYHVRTGMVNDDAPYLDTVVDFTDKDSVIVWTTFGDLQEYPSIEYKLR